MSKDQPTYWLSRYIVCAECSAKAEYTHYKGHGVYQYLCDEHAQDIKREMEEQSNV